MTQQRGAFESALPLARAPLQNPAEPTDSALVIAARDSREAFAPLYQRYVEPVYRYCLRRVTDPEIAADLTSTIFTRVIEALPGFAIRQANATGGNTFRSWLFTIAHNVVVDHHRRRRPSGPMPLDSPDHDPGPEARAVHGDEFTRLMAALNTLPEQHRAIINLRLAGLSSAEIAATLNLSRAAVKSAQTRAYARLRDLLEPPPTGAAS